MAAELETDRREIEKEKAIAAELRIELQIAKQTLDADTAQVAKQEAAAEAMRMNVEAYRRRIATIDTHEVQRFNRTVEEYNVLASEAFEKRTHLNASIEQYNALVGKHQAQVALVNQLSEAYNAKLLRNGH